MCVKKEASGYTGRQVHWLGKTKGSYNLIACENVKIYQFLLGERKGAAGLEEPGRGKGEGAVSGVKKVISQTGFAKAKNKRQRILQLKK